MSRRAWFCVLVVLLLTPALEAQRRQGGIRRSPGSRDECMPSPFKIGVTQLSPACGGVSWIGPCNRPLMSSLDDITSYGVSSVQIWPHSRLFNNRHENMTGLWEHPDVDLYLIRPMHWISLEESCQSDITPAFENYDAEMLARKFLRRFGHLDKVFVLTNWEGDWQVNGVGCREADECIGWGFYAEPGAWDHGFVDNWRYNCQMYVEKWEEEEDWVTDAGSTCGLDFVSCDGTPAEVCCRAVKTNRWEMMKKVWEKRQLGVEAARAAYPDAKATVLHAITVNRPDGGLEINVAAMIATMDHPPDRIGLSHWRSDVPLVDALEEVHVASGFPRERIFVTEFGSNEAYKGKQYEVFTAEVPQAFWWGAQWVFIWNWRQFHGDGALGLFELNDDGDPYGPPRSGLLALEELLETYEKECP